MNILVPVNGSKASLAAVRHAAQAVKGSGGEIILVNVQPLLTAHAARFTSRSARDALRAERSAQAFADACVLLDAAGVRYRKLAATGRIAATITALADRLRVDQIVLGATRRPGWRQALLSPVPRILDLANVPVSVIGEGRSGAFERFGLPAGVGLGLTALIMAAD